MALVWGVGRPLWEVGMPLAAPWLWPLLLLLLHERRWGRGQQLPLAAAARGGGLRGCPSPWAALAALAALGALASPFLCHHCPLARLLWAVAGWMGRGAAAVAFACLAPPSLHGRRWAAQRAVGVGDWRAGGMTRHPPDGPRAPKCPVFCSLARWPLSFRFSFCSPFLPHTALSVSKHLFGPFPRLAPLPSHKMDNSSCNSSKKVLSSETS